MAHDQVRRRQALAQRYNERGKARENPALPLSFIGAPCVRARTVTLFLLGSLFGGSSFLSGSFLSLRSSFAAAAASGLLGLSLLLGEHSFVVVNKLNEASLGGVTQTIAQFKDAGVTAWTIGNLLRDVLEELGNGFFALEVAEHYAARSGIIGLSTIDDGLGIDAKSLGLGQSGEDSLVKNQRGSHIGQHSVAMRFLAAQMIEFLIVSHRLITLSLI